MARDQYEQFLAELARKRAPAVAAAEELVAQGRFDEADRAVVAADGSIYGCVALARLYREHLEALVRGGAASRDRCIAVFNRALRWAQSAYPEPHTEIEAEDYRRGRAADRARLVGLLGFDPDEA